MDVQISPAFESIHSLRKRVGVNRPPEEHLYRSIANGIPSLSRQAGRRQFPWHRLRHRRRTSWRG